MGTVEGNLQRGVLDAKGCVVDYVDAWQSQYSICTFVQYIENLTYVSRYSSRRAIGIQSSSAKYHIRHGVSRSAVPTHARMHAVPIHICIIYYYPLHNCDYLFFGLREANSQTHILFSMHLPSESHVKYHMLIHRFACLRM